MATWKELFGSEICDCGKKSEYIKTNGRGGVLGFQCRECYLEAKRKKDREVLRLGSSGWAKPAKWNH